MASQEMMDFILDQLADLPGIRARKMFGCYAVYLDDKVLALMGDGQLFVKQTPQGIEFVGDRFQEGFAYPGARASILIGADDLEDSDRLCRLMRMTADALPEPKLRLPSKAKKVKTQK